MSSEIDDKRSFTGPNILYLSECVMNENVDRIHEIDSLNGVDHEENALSSENKCEIEFSDDDVFGQTIECQFCTKTFSTKSNLIKHAKKFHAEYKEYVQSLSSRQALECGKCSQKYRSFKKFNSHVKTDHFKHSRPSAKKKQDLFCPVCQHCCKKEAILLHFKNAHDIDTKQQEFHFNSFDDFLTWKSDIERSTKSRYVRYSRNRTTCENNKKHYYRCYRSGNFVTKGQGIRRLKYIGSNKINAYCPASLKITEYSNGKCTVSYQSVHVGHEIDLGRLFPTGKSRAWEKRKAELKRECTELIESVQTFEQCYILQKALISIRSQLKAMET